MTCPLIIIIIFYFHFGCTRFYCSQAEASSIIKQHIYVLRGKLLVHYLESDRSPPPEVMNAAEAGFSEGDSLSRGS